MKFIQNGRRTNSAIHSCRDMLPGEVEKPRLHRQEEWRGGGDWKDPRVRSDRRALA